MNQELLKEAFTSFLDASKSLETYFLSLQEKIKYLTGELEKANTELKKSLEDKEKAYDFLDTVLNSLNEAIIVLDRQGYIVMFNAGAEKLFSVRRNFLINRPYSDLGINVKKDGDTQYIKINNQFIPVIFSEYTVKNKNREEKGKVVVIKDISKVKEMENLYERNKRLIAMGEMAAKIVHEIRSPLCSIELFASMLREEKDCKRKDNLINGIINGISSMNNILSNMLYFAKERKVRGKEVPLSAIIDDVVDLFKPVLMQKEVTLKVVKQNLVVYCDEDLLKQAVFNILQNAFHAVAENGVIEIATRRKKEFVIISIKDNGTGISNENLDKIFDPFFTTKESGTGLGLAITLKIIEAHKGFIKVKSKLNNGTEFRIFLPIGGGNG